MAQNYVVMARKNLLKPSEAPKYYAVARSGRKVTVKEVCKRITERSSYSKGELEGCIGEFLLEIVNVLDEEFPHESQDGNGYRNGEGIQSIVYRERQSAFLSGK